MTRRRTGRQVAPAAGRSVSRRPAAAGAAAASAAAVAGAAAVAAGAAVYPNV